MNSQAYKREVLLDLELTFVCQGSKVLSLVAPLFIVQEKPEEE